jgi:hypothetical protein
MGQPYDATTKRELASAHFNPRLSMIKRSKRRVKDDINRRLRQMLQTQQIRIRFKNNCAAQLPVSASARGDKKMLTLNISATSMRRPIARSAVADIVVADVTLAAIGEVEALVIPFILNPKRPAHR